MGRSLYHQFLSFICLASCLSMGLAMTRRRRDIIDDRSSLLSFKNHVIPSNNILTHNWSTNSSPCTWVGVTCAVRHQRVTALNLSHMALTGTISPHLGNLSFLTSLDLSFNSFSGSLPKQLAHLRRLVYISLRHNHFANEIPSWLENFQKLEYLDLGNNSFTGPIPASIGNIQNLQSLYLPYNMLQGSIPREIGNLSQLNVLELRENQLQGSIPSTIFNMSSLSILDLTDNYKLSGSLPVDLCNHLPLLWYLSVSFNQLEGKLPSKYLFKCMQLRILGLSYNKFDGSIPKEIGNLTMLEEVYLGDNILEGSIPKEIGNLTMLEYLDLGNNSFTGPIPASIGNIQNLQSLSLSDNMLQGSIPKEIGNLSQLNVLELRENQLQGSIPSTIFNMSSLSILDLSYNYKLSGSLPVDLCNHLPLLWYLSVSFNQLEGKLPSKYLFKCMQLRILGLSYNKFDGSIPKEIGNLTMLEEVYLGDNILEGHIPYQIFNISSLKLIGMESNKLTGELPRDMGLWLPNLEKISLHSNRLHGKIPSSLSNSCKLTVLELTYNNFTGFIPNTLGNLTSLQRLLLSWNQLTVESRFFSSLARCTLLQRLSIVANPSIDGILPASIGNLSALVLFEAPECQLRYQIPLEMGNLSNLQQLSLYGNELTGPIPPTIGRLKHLEYLDLHDNKLQESIPEALCQALQRLGGLYLDNNRLNGSIPDCIGTELKSLEYLDLSSNKLTSAIPSTLWSLDNLLGLDLSSNMLNGSLSSDIGNLKHLTEMYLSHNQLGGEIPSTIGDAIMLNNLTLDHNNLHGSIPSAISKLISLESLDLSSNNLSGVIPKSMETLKHLSYLNVSINKLHGEIPTGGCFANFTLESFVENDGFCGASRLQVPSCRNATSRRSMSRTVLFFRCILPIIALVILVCVAIIIFKRRQARNFNAPTQTDLVPHSLRKVTYFELVRATNSFSESNLLGSGSFGSVYKAVLLDGINVAVKVFNMQLERTLKSFTVECEVLRKVRHRNLVGITSSCTNLDFMALVLEYMPCGSLEKWLYSHNYCLDISQRLNIMIDVARALEYLHHGQTTPIVHCDLKPSNVLLDEDMVGHVSDFGISKLLGEDEFVSHTNTLATVGYMAPEYGSGGIVSTKGDVYSYGILLMETFTRKRPTDETFSSEMSLRSWVSTALHDSLLSAVVDTNLLSEEDEHLPATKQCVSSIFELALDCSINSHVERIISMVDVVVRLEKIKIALFASNTRAPTNR